MSDIIQTLADAKAACKKGPVAGLQFQVQASDNKMGVIPAGVTFTGTVLAEVSARGKVQAELTCGTAGCTERHVREISDWHQAKACRTHAKSKGKLTEAEKIARAEAKLAEMKAKAGQTQAA